MKTTKTILSILLVFSSIVTNAQLKVLSSGIIENHNQTRIKSSPSNLNDGIDVTGDNPNLATIFDLIWGCYYTPQANNAGLLTLQSTEGAYFTVRANGKVGIFNNNPSCALEVGTVGTNHEIKVNGSIVLTSDERVKENIKDIDNSLDKLKQLKGVSYNFKGLDEKTTERADSSLDNTDTLHKPKFKPQANKNNIGRNYYGFLAQDILKLFPDLVYKDSAGMLGVDYIGIIPLLVNALNEQETTIATQNKKMIDLEVRLTNIENNNNPTIKKVRPNSSTTEINTLSYPVLDQNTPNPFNLTTTIGYYLPNTFGSAGVYVYDMNGGQLKSYTINEKGKGNITIKGSEFSAGMYLYALIADGKVIDTKRMILTK